MPFGTWNKEGVECLTLSDVGSGQIVRVTGIAGGRRLCARLAHMGIYPGVELEVICAGKGLPSIVRVRNATLSLGKGMSQKILVARKNK